MKITKAMQYKETEESRELEVYTANNGYIWDISLKPNIDNLLRKKAKGTYNHEKALEAVLNVTTTAAKQYNKDFASWGDECFTTSDRYTAAVNILQYIEDEYINRV